MLPTVGLRILNPGKQEWRHMIQSEPATAADSCAGAVADQCFGAYLRAEFAEIHSHHPIELTSSVFPCNETGSAAFRNLVEVSKPRRRSRKRVRLTGKYQQVQCLRSRAVAQMLAGLSGLKSSRRLLTTGATFRGAAAGGNSVGQCDESPSVVVSTGVAPDPRMYESCRRPGSSTGAAEVGRWHHYLLTGSEGYIEAIAQGWKWIPGRWCPVDFGACGITANLSQADCFYIQHAFGTAELKGWHRRAIQAVRRFRSALVFLRPADSLSSLRERIDVSSKHLQLQPGPEERYDCFIPSD